MEGQFAQLLPAVIYQVMFIFCRVGTAFMVMTGFGEAYVPARARLALGMLISVILVGQVGGDVPALPTDPASLLLLLGGEMVVGAYIGMVTQILLSTLTTAGTIIAFQAGLANAFLFNPATAQQSAIPAAFLGAIGLTMIFMTDLHHLMLAALVESYGVFVPGQLAPVEDFSGILPRLVSGSFFVAIQLSAPYIFAGTLFYVGLGILARLMPQVQIFFIAVPIQVLLGFAIMLATLSITMFWFLEYFEENILQHLMR
ncbi:MAG: flagellar biosynthetic protein FliR [Alphaproteobacteria bacterium]|nr:flagellar biosynthetic protein FliR [Alphaproteobacteria bacterium]